ncbi:MAG: hypothetical protein ACTS3R_09915 [Inquilinaceae bacterium]
MTGVVSPPGTSSSTRRHGPAAGRASALGAVKSRRIPGPSNDNRDPAGRRLGRVVISLTVLGSLIGLMALVL